jgi:hypothetical protein
VAGFFPLSPEALSRQSASDQERLDAYAIRYARCQDLLFPAMRALGRAQLEPNAEAGFLELHSLMEKQGIAPDRDQWERLRSLRNAVRHEYPDTAVIVDILNGIHAATPGMLAVVARLGAAAGDLLPVPPTESATD